MAQSTVIMHETRNYEQHAGDDNVQQVLWRENPRSDADFLIPFYIFPSALKRA